MKDLGIMKTSSARFIDRISHLMRIENTCQYVLHGEVAGQVQKSHVMPVMKPVERNNCARCRGDPDESPDGPLM
jgi:hypothetical protein